MSKFLYHYIFLVYSLSKRILKLIYGFAIFFMQILDQPSSSVLHLMKSVLHPLYDIMRLVLILNMPDIMVDKFFDTLELILFQLFSHL
jgi:hypothetical protein